MANFEVLKDILGLVKEDLSDVGPENGVGYTMPDGQYHIYIYLDEIDDEKVYVLEPNRVEDGAHEPFVGDTYIVAFEDYAELLLGCEWCMEQFDRDKETVLTQANAVGDLRIEFDLGAVKLVAEPNVDKDYKEIVVGLMKDNVYLQDLAVIGPEYTYDNNGELGKPVLDEKKIAVRVYSDKNDEDYTHKFSVEVYEEPEVVHEYHGMKIFEKNGRFAVGSVNNSEFNDCTLENLQALAEESEMVEYCRRQGIIIEFVDLKSNDKSVSFERYQEHISKFKTEDSDSFLDDEFIVPCAYFESLKQAMDFVDFVSSERTVLGQKWSKEDYEHKGNKELFDGSFKYWSNACGELHKHGEYDVTEDELPEPLKRAYNELWGEGYSSLCYLVETPSGYGVALINEYDDYTASVKECTMDELFSAVQADKEKIMKDPCYQNATVYAGDYTGINDCHELVVVFPADTPFDEFDAAAKKLEFLAYSSVVKENASLSDVIKDAEQQRDALDSKETIDRGNTYEL